MGRHDDLRDQLTLAGQHLETSALHFFGSNGWFQPGILVMFSQNFTLVLFILVLGCKLEFFTARVFAYERNFVIMGMILSIDR
jgi:hypothetical protein